MRVRNKAGANSGYRIKNTQILTSESQSRSRGVRDAAASMRASLGKAAQGDDEVVNEYVYSTQAPEKAAQTIGASSVQARAPILMYDKSTLSFSNVPFSEVSETDLETLTYLFGRAGLSNKMNSLINSLPATDTPIEVDLTVTPDAVRSDFITLEGGSVSAGKSITVPVARSGEFDRGVGPCVIPLIRVRISMQTLLGVLNNIKMNFSGVYDRQVTAGQLGYHIDNTSGADTIDFGKGTSTSTLRAWSDKVICSYVTIPGVPDQLQTGDFTINLNKLTSAMEFYILPFDVFEGKTYIASIIAQPQVTSTVGDLVQSGLGVTMHVGVRPTGCAIDMELITAMHPNFREYKQRVYGQTVFYE